MRHPRSNPLRLPAWVAAVLAAAASSACNPGEAVPAPAEPAGSSSEAEPAAVPEPQPGAGAGIDAETNAEFEAACPQPSRFCIAPPDENGCTPTIGWSGSPTLSGPDDFALQATNVPGEQWGFLVWSVSEGRQAFARGTLCLTGTLVETPPQESGGSAGKCDGSLRFAFTQEVFRAHGLAPGTVVYAQFVHGDREQALEHRTPTTGVLFVICP